MDSDEDQQGTLDYLPNQIDFDPTFHNENAQILFQKKNKDSLMFKELLLGLALCHHATQIKSSKHGGS